jgi:pimeloyl-ACP methyl ester carboxylesterase
MTNMKGADGYLVDEINYQLDDLNLTALAYGNKDHPPVLCLHGYLDNAASFLPLIQASDTLTEKRFIALEWPGHGHSDHRHVGAHYHFIDYVSDLVALFALNHWQAIDIVAHSMGGMVASAFAAAFPEKVKSLTLIDSFGFICSSAKETTKQLRNGMLSRVTSAKPLREFTKETAIKARLHVSDLKDKHAKLIVSRSLINVQQTSSCFGVNDSAVLYRWRSDPRLRTISPYRITHAQGKQLLSDIKCPVQLVYGNKGMDMVIKGLESFSSCISNLVTVKLAGGHHVHMEQAQALSALLESFYQKNKIKTGV